MMQPQIGKNVYVAEGAIIRGNVEIADDTGIWFNAVIRSEASSVKIGRCSNIQDNAVVHTDPWNNVQIGDFVTVGHGAIIHGCTIGDNTLVGMGAIVMNDAVVGKNCIIGAGALVTERTVIPDNSLVVGSPAKVIKTVDEKTAHDIKMNAEHYVSIAKEYMDNESNFNG